MYEVKYLKEIIEEAIAGKEVFLVDLKIGKSNSISVYLDSPKGVSIDECVEVSRFIESSLDRENEDFELEVSSAGIGYPFLVEQQYFKNIDKDVEVILKSGEKFEGILKAYRQTSVDLEYSRMVKPEGKKRKVLVTEIRNFEINNIKSIKVILSF